MQIDELIHEITKVVDTDTWVRLQPVFEKFKHDTSDPQSNRAYGPWIENTGKNPFVCLEAQPLIEVRFSSFYTRIGRPEDFNWSFRYHRGCCAGWKHQRLSRVTSSRLNP